MPDFPAAVPDLPDATVSETLFTMHTNIGHVPATNRILLNLRALAGKLGIGASTPSSPGVLRQSGVAGTTAWGQVQPGDISPGTGNANRSLVVNPGGTAVAYAAVPSGGLVGAGAGSPNTVARTTDGTNVVYGKVTTGDILDGTILPADVQAGGSGNTFLHTSAGGVVAWTQVAAADVPANALNASSLFAGGTGNRVLRTNDGTNALWGQATVADVAPGAASSVLQTNAGGVVAWLTNLLVSGSIQAGGKLYPSNQTNMGLDVPVSNVAVASGGLALIGTNGRMGLAVVIDAGSGQTGLFQLMGSANQVAMLAGNASVFDVVNGAAGKINCIYSPNVYYLQNSTAGARPLTCMFFGIGT